ncbi:hypothetical protein [Chromobacterium phragmitis]|uniref:Uncharacterized protein n=1 Tax=Chromobacterium phragmitis TaxID=2202141 RepID=A0A344UC70_9NEIS|nr:hypothetical protein [Chromobacterium phragmitis]AXE32868.1 hypothetical protein DK843_00240 [Chromobacterium phragmitis]
MPFVLAPVRAGFPSPADDYLDDSINLHEYLVALAELREIYRRGYLYHNAGILLQEIGPRAVAQADLFAVPLIRAGAS